MSNTSSGKKYDVRNPPGLQLLITAGIVGLISLGTTYCGVDSVVARSER